MSPTAPVPVTVARGDGIGPEIMDATLKILDAGGARLAIEEIEVGEKIYTSGQSSGIAPEAWESLRRTKVFLKAPITTPQGGGFKSLNVTIRKTLGLYANIRPCVSYDPFVATKHPTMDMLIIRENEEDLYAGIEHRQTDEVFQCLKLVSRPGCEKIIRYAFESTRRSGRKHLTCMSKDNIMKLTDGLFHNVFDEVAADYPDIETNHMIIDIGMARVAARPEDFDAIVTLNLYGDILSDIAAEIAGSVGLAGSANIGEHCAMFEAIHGSASDIAGEGIANPSGLLLGAVQMLSHIGQADAATDIHNAWLRTIEDGVHTADIHTEGRSKMRVGTDAFASAVIDRLGMRPHTLKAVSYQASGDGSALPTATPTKPAAKETIGVDIFLCWADGSPADLGGVLTSLESPGLDLQMITNRGVKVWPDGMPETFCTDHWRCRFMGEAGQSEQEIQDRIVRLLGAVNDRGLDFIKIETLRTFDGEPGYSLGQGQ